MKIVELIVGGVFISLWSLCLWLAISTTINVIRDK